MSGELTKLKILAFRDAQYRMPAGLGFFLAKLNPETYKINYKIDFNASQGSGTSGSALKYIGSLPDRLDLEFLFDGTGALSTGTPFGNGLQKSDLGVEMDIQLFKKTVLDYNGDTHEPNYLIISWGTLLFKGRMTKMEINYKMFNSYGIPLRASINTTFKSSIADEKREAKEKNSSPDLTHVRTVKAGDTLPLMSHRIYGSSRYYLEVAKANKITNFRKLEIGQKIFFPPLQK